LTPRNHQEADFNWETAVDLAIASQAKRLVISLHHPDDDDYLLDRVQAKMKSVLQQAVLAREGLILNVVT
jgi:phosphoribosyl 1,2-cyclic phosphodiesterase